MFGATVTKFFFGEQPPSAEQAACAARLLQADADVAHARALAADVTAQRAALCEQRDAAASRRPDLLMAGAQGDASAALAADDAATRCESLSRQIADADVVLGQCSAKLARLALERHRLEHDQLEVEYGAMRAEQVSAAETLDAAGLAFRSALRAWIECDLKATHLHARAWPGKNLLSLAGRLEFAISHVLFSALPETMRFQTSFDVSVTSARKHFSFVDVTPKPDPQAQTLS